jgi:hypothetical protein
MKSNPIRKNKQGTCAYWNYPEFGVGEKMLAERHADAHDDDIVEVALCTRDHEESNPARSR